MKIELPENVKNIIAQLKRSGYDAYAVGGCVRDSVLGRKPQDWDITTSARPEQVKQLFARTLDTGIAHGTVTIMIGPEGYEVTTYRIDGEYEDARHPKEVTFTADLLEDLKRRDFTINAMAYNDETGFVDAFDGLGDLKRGLIRCVGKASERFSEDALRMLRAVRFAAQLGFTIDNDTCAAIRCLAPTLEKISAERIQAELVKLLTSPHPEFLLQAYELGITDVILPEFSRMMQTPQNTPYHRGNVGMHTIWTLQAIRPDRILRITMLLHDVAKPVCRTTDEFGRDHFKGHQIAGADMAKQILRRLKFDNDTIRRVTALILAHDDRPPVTERNIRRAIARNGEEQYPDLFDVKQADIIGQSDYFREKNLAWLADCRRTYEAILEKQQCFSLKQLAVCGKDLIAAGMKPGKELGETLNAMLELVLEDPEYNRKELLMKYWRDGRL